MASTSLYAHYRLLAFAIRVGGLSLAFAAWPSSTAAQTQNRASRCYDAVVVARIADSIPTPIPDDPDAIVMRWPWHVEVDVDQVVMGRLPLGPRNVMASLHNDLPEESYLLFLRRRGDGRHWIEHWSPVVEDRRGRFVILANKPFEPSQLEPTGWLPGNYENWLRPVRYQPRDAWWLMGSAAGGNPRTTPGWSRRIRDGVLALRGLYVDDLPRLFGERARCASSPAASD